MLAFIEKDFINILHFFIISMCFNFISFKDKIFHSILIFFKILYEFYLIAEINNDFTFPKNSMKIFVIQIFFIISQPINNQQCQQK